MVCNKFSFKWVGHVARQSEERWAKNISGDRATTREVLEDHRNDV